MFDILKKFIRPRKRPAISVVIPVYNVEKYLAECLDSLLGQTMTDFEVICVNDGSSDGSPTILDEYCARDRRIRLISQKNQGISAARNAGARQAVGEYLYFMDSDDTLEKNALELLRDRIRTTRADIVVFGMNDMMEGAADIRDPWFEFVSSPKERFYSPFTPDVVTRVRGSHPFVWRNIFRRALLTENELEFESDVRYGEDLLYQMCVFPYAERIQFISDKLYNYRRRRGDSLTVSAKAVKTEIYKKHIDIVKRILRFWEERGLLEKYGGQELYSWLLMFVGGGIKKLPEGDERRILAGSLLEALPSLADYVGGMRAPDRALYEEMVSFSGRLP